jgi:osmotically-inducible protein OsmY
MSGSNFTGGTGINSAFRGGFNGNWAGSFSGGGTYRGGAASGTNGTGTAGTGTVSTFSPYYVNPLAPGAPNLTQLPNFNLPIYSGNGNGSLQGGYGLGSSNYGFPGSNSLGANQSQGGTGYGAATGAKRVGNYSASPTFDYRPAGPSLLQSEVQRVLTRSSSLSPNRAIRVAVEGPAVVLRGTVASEHDRRLAEALVRLTPGVHEVRNELEVPEITPAPEPRP